MAFLFPWSNFHELNLDWILSVVKEAKEIFESGESDIQHAVETADQALETAEQAASGVIADGAVTIPKINDAAFNLMAYVVSGSVNAVAIPAASLVILRKSTVTGVNDGIYVAAADIPANSVITAADLTQPLPLPDAGGLNYVMSVLGGEIDNTVTSINAIERGLVIVVDGDSATSAVPVGGLAYLKNNANGLQEGVYANISNAPYPATGGTADASVFSAVPNVLNSLKQDLTTIETIAGDGILSGFTATDLTGAANELKTDVNLLRSELNIFSEHKYVFIGDSFGVRTNGWIDFLNAKLNLTPNTDSFSSAAGGSGFCNPTTFLSLLNTLAGSMTADQKDSITDIITVGGINDTYVSYTQSDVESAVETYCNRVAELFPNAKRHVIFYNCSFVYPWITENSRKQYEYRTRQGIISGVASSGKINSFYQGAENLLNFSDYIDTTDGAHLTSLGQAAFGYYILNAINGGKPAIQLRSTVHGISFIFSDANVVVQVNQGDLYNNSSSPINVLQNAYTTLYTGLRDLPYYGSLMIPVVGVLVDSGGTNQSFNGIVRLYSGNQSIQIFSDVALSNVVRVAISGTFTGTLYYN